MFEDPFGFATCRYSISEHTLCCDCDDGKTSARVSPENVFSGDGQCRNDPACAGKKDEGPTPPGDYEMVPSTKYGGSWWLKDPWIQRQLWKLGIGRSGFFLHLGTVSLGCITVIKTKPAAVQEWENLKKLLEKESKNTMTVVN